MPIYKLPDGSLVRMGSNKHIHMSPVTPAKVLNTQSKLADIQKNVPAEGEPIPIVYGTAQVGGKVFAIDYNAAATRWTVGYVVALGEIDGFETVWINGVDASTIAGLSVSTHTGTDTQTPDTFLSFAISGYADDLVINDPAGDIGIAYVVLQYTDAVLNQWPEIICEIRGRKVWNPKTATTAFSTNPALHLGDYLSNAIYGRGLIVNDTALEATQDYCDDNTPGEVRRTGFFVIDSPQPAEQWVEMMKTYASCWVIERGNEAHLVPDKPGASVKNLTAKDVIEGSVRIIQKDSSELPTVVRAFYTDTTPNIWREVLCDAAKAAGVDAGTTPWRESRIRLPGCPRHSQANRECIERLDKLALSGIEVTWEAFDEAMELEQGDIVTLTHFYGLSTKALRIIDVPVQSKPGRWRLRATEYNAAAYDDTVDAGTSQPDSTFPKGGVPSAPASLTATPVWFQTEDMFWRSRFKIEWTPPADGSLVARYFVAVAQGGEPIWDTMVAGSVLKTATPALAEGLTYDISVAGEFAGIIGPAIVDAEVLTLNTVAPGTPTGVSASVRNAVVYLDWDAMPDAQYYEIRQAATGGTWASGTVIDPKRHATNITIDQSAHITNTRRFMVRAYDSVGNNSNEGFVEVVITSIDSITIFYQGQSSDGIPTALAAGDLWYDTDNDSRPYRATNAGDDQITAGEWELESETLQNKIDLSFVNTVSTVQTGDFTAVSQNRYPVDTETNHATTTAGGLELTLPDNPTHMEAVYFWDANAFFDVNPCIVKQNANGHHIMELNEDMVCDVRFFSGGLQYVTGIGWQLV